LPVPFSSTMLSLKRNLSCSLFPFNSFVGSNDGNFNTKEPSLFIVRPCWSKPTRVIHSCLWFCKCSKIIWLKGSTYTFDSGLPDLMFGLVFSVSYLMLVVSFSFELGVRGLIIRLLISFCLFVAPRLGCLLPVMAELSILPLWYMRHCIICEAHRMPSIENFENMLVLNPDLYLNEERSRKTALVLFQSLSWWVWSINLLVGRLGELLLLTIRCSIQYNLVQNCCQNSRTPLSSLCMYSQDNAGEAWKRTGNILSGFDGLL